MRRFLGSASHIHSRAVFLLWASRQAAYTFRQSSAYDTTSPAFKERRAQAAKWETAVFGKMFYEPGSRERFVAASAQLEEEEKLRLRLQTERGDSDDRGGDRGSGASDDAPSNGTAVPPYHIDMTVEEMLGQPLPIVKRHIVTLLTRGENRLLNAPDYGSYLMMNHMHKGNEMIRDAEELLNRFGLMTPSIEDSIDDLRTRARQIQHDLDLVD
jgi:hypothetical protein